MIRSILALLAFLGAASAMAPARAQSTPQAEVTIFAAASLTQAIQAIADDLARSGGPRLKTSLAASSTLARQIEAGAQASVFISADQEWMSYLDQRGLLVAGTRRDLLSNRLVMVVPADRPLTLDLGSTSWLSQLPAGRIATGDPAHVPVGRYAQQALTTLGVWDSVAPRLARADNVRSALVLVERGEAVAGIVYATDAAASSRVSVAGTFPSTSHPPIVYPIAIVRGGDNPATRAVYEALHGPAARAIYTRLGFTDD